MHQFHDLTITAIQQEPNAVVWTLAIPEKLCDQFEYLPGQHLTFKYMHEGEELRRSYSICSSSLNASEMKVLIKGVDGGRFSQAAQSVFNVGDTVSVMPPSGHFSITPEEEKTYVAFSAGSGITPVMGMVHAVLEQTETSQFVLFYGNSTSGDILLQQEISHLKDHYQERFSVHYFLSRQKVDMPFNHGRLDQGKVAYIKDHFLNQLNVDGYYVCGPGEMIDSVCRSLELLGVPQEQIHNERFLSDGQEITASEKIIKEDAGITVTVDGANHQFDIKAGESATLLESAEQAGVDLPYSCKAGVCATCRCKLIEGEVEMINNYSLEDWETKDGYILSCQSVARSSKIHISFDE